MDELRGVLKKDSELGSLAMRLSDLFSQADINELMKALEKGDMVLASQILHTSHDELEKVFKSFRDNASRLATKYPDLADFAKSMKATGSL